MSRAEIMALDSGIYSMLIMKNKFRMKVNHETELEKDKVTFWYELYDNIYLSNLGESDKTMALITIVNNVNFIRLIQNDDIQFEDERDCQWQKTLSDFSEREKQINPQ